MKDNDIKVTVICITYKHEEFIAQALDSFLMQKTNFKFQIFVGEDCGPDKTADIVRKYAERYPDIVIPYIRTENMGAQRNLIDLCSRASSRYLAFCEGDDYWTDEYKLQKQYDFMEKNPEVRVCFAKAEILAPSDWFLRSYFKEDNRGKLIFPDCDPSYKKEEGYLKAKSFISFLQAHTSTLFYRWNYELEIPEWYFDGYIGDWPLFLMQLGDGYAASIPDVVSVYRRSDVGVYMSENLDEHFLKTRRENVRLLTGMIDFYEENYPYDYPKILIENRIKNDIALFIQSAMRVDEWNEITKLFEDYPYAGKLAFNAFTSFYFDSQRMSNVYSWEGNQLVARNKYFMHLMNPFIRVIIQGKKIIKSVLKKIVKGVIYLCKFCGFWIFTMVPKNKSLWVFSGFKKTTYLDNTRYFYEYVHENCHDISAVWVTRNKEVYEELKRETKNVVKMNSLKGIWTTARAAIAVTDHFIMSDYSPIYGFNNNTKVVQLWHGVGFKAMGDGATILNTDVKGVQYCDDILIDKNDPFLMKLKKKIGYFFKAPVRELFEKYFIFVCPGQERIDMIGKMWRIPEKSYFMAGHPRNINLYNNKIGTGVKVLYAPTYRFNVQKEREMVQSCIDAFPMIQEYMEKVNGNFVLRLHPHTWRNYKSKILHHMHSYSRISFDEEKDIYTVLQEYSVVITDYSSIALDFAMLDRPVIFYTFDYEWFCQHDAGFNLDFEQVIPGPQTYNWNDTLNEVERYIMKPTKDSEMRRKKCAYFFDELCNGPDNSRRIYEEIKRRLSV